MMGVGKSTIGRLLSKKLRMPFEDLDSNIESKASLTIKEIFNLKGEAYFRKLEENESIGIISKAGKVIALGGGTFVNEKVREQVKKNCFSVWLDLEIKEIFERTKKNNGRPLLINVESIKDIEKIYLERKEIYALADFKLDCTKKSKEQIVDEIEKIYENI